MNTNVSKKSALISSMIQSSDLSSEQYSTTQLSDLQGTTSPVLLSCYSNTTGKRKKKKEKLNTKTAALQLLRAWAHLRENGTTQANGSPKKNTDSIIIILSKGPVRISKWRKLKMGHLNPATLSSDNIITVLRAHLWCCKMVIKAHMAPEMHHTKQRDAKEKSKNRKETIYRYSWIFDCVFCFKH